jgi:hypothetical protein
MIKQQDMRRQLVFVSSRDRHTGTVGSFQVVLGDSVIKRDDGCVVSFALVEATIPRSWPSLRQGENSFWVNGVQCLLPTDAYLNAADLRAAIQALLPPQWLVSFSRQTAKLTFTAPSPGGTLTIPSAAMRTVLGFNSDTLAFTVGSGLTRTSDRPIRVSGENAVLVHADLPQGHMASVLGGTASQVIAKIPLRVPVFANIVYEDSTSAYEFRVPSLQDVSALNLWLTDENNRPLEPSHDWSMTLRVTHDPLGDTPGGRTAMDKVADTLQLMLLENNKSLQ